MMTEIVFYKPAKNSAKKFFSCQKLYLGKSEWRLNIILAIACHPMLYLVDYYNCYI